jgi:hypothetical protein
VSHPPGQSTERLHLLDPAGRIFKTLALSDVRNRFDDMGLPVSGHGFRPLDENPLIAGKRHLIHRHFSRVDRFGHFAERAGRRTSGDFLMTGLTGDISEFVEPRFVLELDPVSLRIDH